VTIHVRRATDGDLLAMIALLAELHDPPTALADPDTWERMLAQEGRVILLAEVDGEPAATADVSIAPNRTHDAQSRAYVENVAVAAGHRRRGVGRALMTEVERVARDAGCYKVPLMSADHRDGAHRFYEELGYERCAVGFRKSFEGS
jgi:GNAT superfamily N-acetyltransferase